MQAHIVESDGSLKSVEINSYKELNSEKAYVFVDVENETIYAWKGMNAANRLRFMAARAARDLRTEYGRFRIDVIDQGDEPINFKTRFSSLSSQPASTTTDSSKTGITEVHPFFHAQEPKLTVNPLSQHQASTVSDSFSSPSNQSTSHTSHPAPATFKELEYVPTSPSNLPLPENLKSETSKASYDSSEVISVVTSSPDTSPTHIAHTVSSTVSDSSSAEKNVLIQEEWIPIDDTAPIIIKRVTLNVKDAEKRLPEVSVFINDHISDFQIKRSGTTSSHRNWNQPIDIAVYHNDTVIGCIRASHKGGVLIIDLIITNSDIKRAEEQLLLEEVERYCQKKQIHKISVLVSENDPFLNKLIHRKYEIEGSLSKHIFNLTWFYLSKII
ncbi:MAG: hypothetical protein ACFFC7_02940 [Candidatus Hermodarchaeota archaeon]